MSRTDEPPSTGANPVHHGAACPQGEVKVPNFKGMTVAQAQAAATSAGLGRVQRHQDDGNHVEIINRDQLVISNCTCNPYPGPCKPSGSAVGVNLELPLNVLVRRLLKSFFPGLLVGVIIGLIIAWLLGWK